MRPKTSLLTALAAMLMAPAALAGNVSLPDTPLCLRSAETGQVQCSGTVAGLEQLPMTVQVIAPYHCQGAATRPVPSLAIGESQPIEGGDIRAFALMTQPADCEAGQPAILASQISLQVIQEGQVVLRRNVPLSPRPQPQH